MARSSTKEIPLSEAAFRLQKGYQAAYQMLLSGRLDGRRDGTRWLVTAESVERELSARAEPPAPSARVATA